VDRSQELTEQRLSHGAGSYGGHRAVSPGGDVEKRLQRFASTGTVTMSGQATVAGPAPPQDKVVVRSEKPQGDHRSVDSWSDDTRRPVSSA
jgi:hypothetical protein